MVRIVIICLALSFAACAKNHANNSAPSAPTPPPSGPAAAVQTTAHHGEGVVKAVFTNPKAPAIEIEHGDIEGLMPAMQMEFPVTDAKLLEGIAVNDRIDFTVENATDGMRVTSIKKK
jgi:Cu/Ag efflux protein CusF